MSPRVCLGVITAPHGVRGMVKIKSFTDDPKSVSAYGPVATKDGRTFTVDVGGTGKNNTVLASLTGIATRDDAALLKGEALFVDRDALPAPGDGTVYQADLIGRMVHDPHLGNIGKVVGVHDFGGGTLLEISREGGNGAVFVPFNNDNAEISGDRISLAVDPVWLEE